MKRIRAVTVLALIIITIVVLVNQRDAIEHAAYPQEYQEYVSDAAEKYDLEEALIFAVIHTESHFDPDAKSGANAMGLMQITKDTFFFVNSKDSRGDLPLDLLYDPEVNIDTGSYFLRWLIDDFGNTDTAIAAYNAGRTTVRKWLADDRYSKDGVTLYDIPYKETKDYVKKVNSAYLVYKDLYY